jgi:hypothetical protein
LADTRATMGLPRGATFAAIRGTLAASAKQRSAAPLSARYRRRARLVMRNFCRLQFFRSLSPTADGAVVDVQLRRQSALPIQTGSLLSHSQHEHRAVTTRPGICIAAGSVRSLGRRWDVRCRTSERSPATPRGEPGYSRSASRVADPHRPYDRPRHSSGRI